jgi:hypothetical protein
MPDYRCYPMSGGGSIDGPAHVLDCTNDASAIATAHTIFPERAFEIWEGARRVYVSRRGKGAGAVKRDQISN